jgi:serine/threonine protein kinase
MNDASRRFADRYEILDQIAGGSSIVWKARDTKVGRTVAIKTPSDVVVRTPEQLSRFIEEARVLGKLDHPNILEILHFFERGEVDDRCHIVSKWFDTDLAKVVRRTDLSWQTKLPIMAKILSAITYLHQQGLIHRDLKPDNVFLTEDLNDVRVADLGIASAKGAAAHTVRGTFKYMAPPLPNQETSDARLDIYSLGITFFELLAGESHFKEAFSDVYGAGGGSPGDPRWLHWHLDQARCLPPLNSLDPEIPTILSDVVARMAEKDAARRFRDLTEVTAALQPLLGEGHDGGGAQVLDEKDFHVQKKKTKDISKALVVSIGLAIIVLAIVAVFVFTPPDEPSKLAAPTAEHPAMVSTKEASGLAAPAVAPPHKLQTLRALIEKAVAVAVVPDAPQLVGARAVASRSTASDDEASAEVRNLQQAIAQSPRLASLGSSAAEIDRALSWCRESGMTCNPKDFDDEALRSVRLAPFALDNEEVTNGEFAEFVKATAFRTDASGLERYPSLGKVSLGAVLPLRTALRPRSSRSVV